MARRLNNYARGREYGRTSVACQTDEVQEVGISRRRINGIVHNNDRKGG